MIGTHENKWLRYCDKHGNSHRNFLKRFYNQKIVDVDEVQVYPIDGKWW